MLAAMICFFTDLTSFLNSLMSSSVEFCASALLALIIVSASRADPASRAVAIRLFLFILRVSSEVRSIGPALLLAAQGIAHQAEEPYGGFSGPATPRSPFAPIPRTLGCSWIPENRLGTIFQLNRNRGSGRRR